VVPNELFVNQPKAFWANVRSISQQVGYTERSRKEDDGGRIKVPSFFEIAQSLQAIGLTADHLVSARREPTELGSAVHSYFQYRAKVLDEFVEPRLLSKDSAKDLFTKLRDELKPRCPIPMNKQKGDKRAESYFTGIINMLIEAHSAGVPCDYDPRELTTVTLNNVPLRTLARRVDGAFPSPVNPIAVWEIKEYYYTTTFGSRVADGVYETLLDGMELEELREHENIDVKHYLMVDDHYTWWECGRSYLCRIIDMLHMGYVDEALFGREVVERLPSIVPTWVEAYRKRLSK
jgi:hypothetical protein